VVKFKTQFLLPIKALNVFDMWIAPVRWNPIRWRTQKCP